MILGEAVDEELVGANPCRKLRLTFNEMPERPHASADEVDAIACRMTDTHALLTITGAYTGLRWGELAGLRWDNTPRQRPPHRDRPPTKAHCTRSTASCNSARPRHPSGVRPAHLPTFLVEFPREHRDNNPTATFVFTGEYGGLLRRSTFRRRAWLPALALALALAGDANLRREPIQPNMHFHDLRHAHKTWLIEDKVPRVLQLRRLGHRGQSVDDDYSHVTRPMIDAMLAKLQV